MKKSLQTIEYIKTFILLAVMSLLLVFIIVPMSAHAATVNLNTAITWDGNCADSIDDNGSTTAYAYYANGDTVNLTVANNSSEALEIGIKGQSPTPVPSNSSSQAAISLGSEADVVVYSNSCSQANESDLLIFGDSGSITCSLQSKVWNLAVNYNGTEPSISLYRSGTYVDTLKDTTGGSGGGSVNTSVQFAGQSSAATYYVYNGTSSSSALIGQATCSPIPTTAITTTTSPRPSASSPSAATPSTPSSNTPAQTTNSSTTPSPTVTIPKSFNVTTTRGETPVSKMIHSLNTNILIGTGVSILVIVLAIVVLATLKIWNAPRLLASKVWEWVMELG
jgi:hypothetical protein